MNLGGTRLFRSSRSRTVAIPRSPRKSRSSYPHPEFPTRLELSRYRECTKRPKQPKPVIYFKVLAQPFLSRNLLGNKPFYIRFLEFSLVQCFSIFFASKASKRLHGILKKIKKVLLRHLLLLRTDSYHTQGFRGNPAENHLSNIIESR